jgi:hypothetical protein
LACERFVNGKHYIIGISHQKYYHYTYIHATLIRPSPWREDAVPWAPHGVRPSRESPTAPPSQERALVYITRNPYTAVQPPAPLMSCWAGDVATDHPTGRA